MAPPSFAELQATFRDFWPTVTLRSIDVERTVVVVHSISFDVPDQLVPVFPAYEERFLCMVLSLLRAPRSRVVYVTSQPIHPRVVDYYFGLVPELDTLEARARFVPVSLVDGRNEPLSRKLLARPGAIRRIKELIGTPEFAMILPFCMSDDEVALAEALEIPIYGSDPALRWLGSKTGSRRVFADEDVPHPIGLDVTGSGDLPEALAELRARSSEARSAVLKLDRGVSGLGNALLDLERATRDLHSAIELGQTYFGCHFPADAEYAERIAAESLKVGRRLAREGVIGRAAVDFAAVRDGNGWRPYALEINLRCGGTTHPLFALTTLTDGVYDPLAAEYRTRYGDIKHYAATDHLDSPAYRSLTPDDLLDVVTERGLGWDSEREAGVVLHMVSAIAVAGRIGLTAIGDTLDEARRHYYAVKAAVDDAAARSA